MGLTGDLLNRSMTVMGFELACLVGVVATKKLSSQGDKQGQCASSASSRKL